MRCRSLARLNAPRGNGPPRRDLRTGKRKQHQRQNNDENALQGVGQKRRLQSACHRIDQHNPADHPDQDIGIQMEEHFAGLLQAKLL